MRRIIYTAASLLLLCAMGATTGSAEAQNHGAPQRDHSAALEQAWKEMADLQSQYGLSVKVLGFRINRKSDSDKRFSDSQSVQNRLSLARPGHIGTYEFGFNALTTVDYSLYPDRSVDFMELNTARSIHFALRIINVAGPITGNGVLSFSTGIQLAWDSYSFTEEIYIYKAQGQIEYGSQYYRRSRLSTFGLTMPLLLEINLPQKFFVAFGCYGGINLGSRSVVKFPKRVVHNPFMNTLYGGLTARAGLGALGVFANYDLTNMFIKDKGPKTSVFTIGVAWGI